MSARTEQVIDFFVAITDFTKLNDTDMRWDGSGSITAFNLDPTLIVNGLLADTDSQLIEVGHILEIAE